MIPHPRGIACRRASAPLCAVLVVLAAACGPSRPAGRLAVEQRDFAWERVAGEPAELSLAWTFDETVGPWSVVFGKVGTIEDGALATRSIGRVELVGPVGAPIDPEVHHDLIVRARLEGVETLTIQWRREDQEYVDARATSRMELPDEPDFQLLSIPLASLRGTMYQLNADKPRAKPRWGKGSDAAEGVDELKLVFEGPKGEVVDVRVDSIVLRSSFDAPDDAAPRVDRLLRHGVYADGVVTSAPGAVATEVTPGPFDRLRLSLAVAGARGSVDVTLTDDHGRLGEHRWTVATGDEWLDAVVDLAPLGGRTTRLTVSASGQAGPRAVLMVGGVLRLGPRERDLPNVVFYVEDTVRADRLGTYGYAFPTDPHLRAVAAEGVVFERTFAASNWTRPSISSMLTSLDPLTHGNRTHMHKVSASATTLAEVMAEGGYLTTSFVTNYHGGAWSGLDQGFDVSREPTAYGASEVDSTLTSETVAGPIDAFLEQHADERLFVVVHTLDPHSPYKPPTEDRYAILRAPGERPPFDGPKADRRAEESLSYDAEILHNDRRLGRLDDTLRRLGLFDSTLLVFASDHGEAFLEHGLLEHRSGLFQEELHVPWVLRWPEGLPAGERRPEAVGHVDMAPTIVGLAGLTVPEGWLGRDLSDVARGEPLPAAQRRPLLSHTVYDEPRDGLLEEIAVVQDGYKLVAGLTGEGELVERSLFHVDADPAEAENLLGRPESERIVASLREWALGEVERGRAADAAEAAAEMDPQMVEWMRAMGYLR